MVRDRKSIRANSTQINSVATTIDGSQIYNLVVSNVLSSIQLKMLRKYRVVLHGKRCLRCWFCLINQLGSNDDANLGLQVSARVVSVKLFLCP
jgi:hypothetical protein